MPSTQFFKHTDTSTIQQLLRNYFPSSIAIYHRIRSPQNTPERHTVVLANFPPSIYSDASSSEIDVPGHVTVSFVDRSRANESQIAIFNTLCLPSTQTKDLPKESRQLLADQLRALFGTIHDIGNSYHAAADNIIKPLNYPFSPILRFTASHHVIADILVHDLGVKPAYYHEWDELIFSTPAVKNMISSRKLPDGYELGRVPASAIDVVVSTSKVQREAASLLANRNAAVLFTNPETTAAAAARGKEVVAWAYLSIDQSLTTLYVQEAHRGKGLAKIVAGSLMRDLCDGFGVEKETQSNWCLAQVAADNDESQGVCRSLGASFHKRTVSLGFDLGAWLLK